MTPNDPLLTRRAALARAAALLGGALAAPTVAGVLAGCGERGAGRPPAADTTHGAPAAAPAPPPPPYQLQALTAAQAALVAAVAEHIIPTTTTPGAREARVHEFVDRMLAEYHPAAVRTRFLAGLGQLDANARRRHGREFLACTPEEQYAMVDAMDARAFGDRPADAGALGRGRTENSGPAAGRKPARRPARRPAGRDAFYRTLKELTVVGYYTSEAGATRELRVNPAGRWRADVPYAALGTGWA